MGPTPRSLRLAFFGTPEFALPTLERLLRGPHRVACVVSQPDRPRGRGRRPHPSPLSEAALRHALPLLRPERVGEASVVAALRDHAPDLGVVVAFGQFLPRSVRELPAEGFLVNGHASLLPRLRGAAPIAHAILAGDAVTGISVMRVVREMDAGPVALRRELAIDPEENAAELAARLAPLCAEAVCEVVDAIAAGTARFEEQDHARATAAPRLSKADAELDWSQPAAALARAVRALAPAPGAVSHLDGEPLRILAARAEPGPTDRAAGGVQREVGAPLRIATADGWLVPRSVQRPGGRALAIEAYLRGRPIPDGARFASPAARLDD